MTDRRSLTVRAARIVQRLPLAPLRPLEVAWVRCRARMAAAPKPVILLAAPRGGSTLAYQSLVHGLDPCYLSNLWNMFYALPWTGGMLSRRRCARHRSDFRSRHGFVGGVCGPAEGLRFWSYWSGVDLDETVPAADDDAKYEHRMGYLHQVLAVLSGPGRPFVAGYLGHALAIDRIRSGFPESVFVRVHRDPLSNAMSILRVMRENGDDWFSVRPRECADTAGAGIHFQVASQVYWLNRRLESVNDDPATIHIDYEGLCDDPNGELDRVVAFCNARGMAIRVRQHLPERFPCTLVTPHDDADASLVAEHLQDLERTHGPLMGRSR